MYLMLSNCTLKNGLNGKLYVMYILPQFKHFDVNPLGWTHFLLWNIIPQIVQILAVIGWHETS